MCVLRFCCLNQSGELDLPRGFGSRAAFASNKTDAAFDETFFARRTVFASGWGLKFRAMRRSKRSAQSRPPGLRQCIPLLWMTDLPCRSFYGVFFYPDECFCKDPTAPLFSLSKACRNGSFNPRGGGRFSNRRRHGNVRLDLPVRETTSLNPVSCRPNVARRLSTG